MARTNITPLRDGWQQLQQVWRSTQEGWDDPATRRFEREQWQEYERTLPPALRELEQICELLSRLERDFPPT